MKQEKNNFPKWLLALADEDVQFLKRFVLASGSLKALAAEYGISYPTIRIRLDRLIEKIQSAEDQNVIDEFHRQLRIMVADGAIQGETAKQLLQAHREVIDNQKDTKD